MSDESRFVYVAIRFNGRADGSDTVLGVFTTKLAATSAVMKNTGNVEDRLRSRIERWEVQV